MTLDVTGALKYFVQHVFSIRSETDRQQDLEKWS